MIRKNDLKFVQSETDSEIIFLVAECVKNKRSTWAIPLFMVGMSQ
jgi:hypothetical protein